MLGVPLGKQRVIFHLLDLFQIHIIVCTVNCSCPSQQNFTNQKHVGAFCVYSLSTFRRISSEANSFSIQTWCSESKACSHYTIHRIFRCPMKLQLTASTIFEGNSTLEPFLLQSWVEDLLYLCHHWDPVMTRLDVLLNLILNVQVF